MTEIEEFESPGRTRLDFCLWCWINCGIYKRRVDTADELIARILDALDRIKESEAKLGRTTGDRRTRVAKCIEVDDGICVNTYCEL